ncbi:MAG: LuxR C-terminal-related transcriptional regulator [Anaerolineae bacterium]|nr:LuxR C-terminal-related transcriptional regulator [Anaerolineae bacterium]
MGFRLSEEAIASLEARTEGWIAGLQLAAVSMKQHQDTASFIRSFTGAHHYVMDYLMEEVLHQQPENIQTFLLYTSILNRMCGSLCDAILDSSPGSGQEKLEVLEHTNLFIVPLDNERRWYRYHHLFAELLRQRLFQKVSSSLVNELHERASLWYEANGLELEAFHHAAASNHIDHATRLMAGGGMPLHFRGAVVPVLNWLASLPVQALDERPALWVMYASASSMAGQHSQVEPKLQAAEAVLKDAELTPTHKNLIGHIAAIRAMMAAEQNQAETIISQSHRALEYLSPNNVPVRTATVWKLGYAYQLQGNRSAAQQAYTEVLASSQASGNVMFQILALTALARLQESAAQLLLAAENYQRALQLLDEMPSPIICEAHLGLARINYEWNKLDSAQQHAQSSVHLARQIENSDRFISGELFLARLRLAQNSITGAAVILANAEQFIHQHQFLYRIPELAAIRVRLLLHQGRLLAAAELAQTHSLPLSQARVLIAQGNLSAALTLLEQELNRVSAKGWEDERLQIMVLQTVAFMLDGKKGTALQVLDEALVMAAPGRFIRRFVDEGLPMMQVLSEAAVRQIMPDYTGTLLAEMQHLKTGTSAATDQLLIEPLSERELEILQLIAQGLSNLEIGERLFLALDTVKGHNRRIYGKLQVQRRTEAVARARDLGLL